MNKVLNIIFILLLGLSSGGMTISTALAQDEVEPDLDGNTEINVKNAEIAAMVRIFSKKTKRNYILDEKVKGKVSIYLPGKVSADESIRILDSVLALKGFTAVPIGENLWKIVPASEGKQSTIPTITDKPLDEAVSATMVTRLVQLSHVNSDDLQQLISPLISSSGLLNAYTGTNSLIIIDFQDNVERLVKIIDSIDVPGTDREMTIIPVEHAEAADVAAKLLEILGESSSGAAEQTVGSNNSAALARARANAAANAARTRTTQANAAAAPSSSAITSTIRARSRDPKIISDERTNSIIVVADDDMTARVKALISQLDSKVDLSGERFYVYNCQHANAEDLADVLGGLTGNSTSSNSTSNTGSTGGLNSSRNSSRNSNSNTTNQRTNSRNTNQQRTPGRQRGDTNTRTGATSVDFGENVSITADPSTNSLIISASRSDYLKIRALLEELDVKRRQVLVEAMLLEVGVDDTETLSTEFISSAGGSDGGAVAQSNFGNLSTLLSDPTQLSQFSVAAASSGTLTLPGDITIPTQTILLNAAHTNSNVNVLSAPNVLTTDNEEAEIVVGQNVPFLASTSTSSDNLNNTFNQIDRQDVGITLRLTPQISSRDFVTLNIFTEVSNVIEATRGSELGPTTTIRTSETTVIAKDSQMIVIGGLMSDDVTSSESGVPFFKDIPVLGHLFRSTIERQRRTNLLIFITPRIIKDQFDARTQTKSKGKWFEDAIEDLDSYPRREAVLNSSSIDSVTEIQPFKGPKPGTITAPNREPVVLSGKTDSFIDSRIDNSSKIEIIVEDEDSPRAQMATPPSTRLKDDRGPLQIPVPSGSGTQFILMKVQDGESKITDIPFEIETNSGSFGIVMPGDSFEGASEFFSVGSVYSYAIDNENISLQPVGIFSSPDEAEMFLGEENLKWHTLSPYEVMRLGKGPWKKRG